MGLLTRIFKRSEKRSVKSSDPYLANYLGRGGASSANVSPENVLSSLAVAHRCVTIRSELIASVPLHLYRRTKEGGRERASEHPLHRALHDQANPNLSAFEAREFLVRSLDLFGNAFFRLQRNAGSQVCELYPVAFNMVQVERLSTGRLRYRVSGEPGGAYVLLQDEMLHVRGPSRDGIMGLSPIALTRSALELAIAQHDTANHFAANALRPSGIFSVAEQLSDAQFSRLKSDLKENFAGTHNAGRFALLDGGTKFESVTIPPADAQFLESRKLANEDVARIFGLPPTTVGITDRATYSNTEQEGRALVQNALGPLASRIEAAIARCCLTDAGRRTYYAEHDLSGLLRGDVKSRFEAYRIGREIGLFSANDIARMENMPPVDGGDERYVPANWMKLGESASKSSS